MVSAELLSAAKKLSERDRAEGWPAQKSLALELPVSPAAMARLTYEDWVKIREAYQPGIGRQAWDTLTYLLVESNRLGLDHAQLGKDLAPLPIGVRRDGVLGLFETKKLAQLNPDQLELLDKVYFQAAERMELFPVIRVERHGQTVVLTGAAPLSLGEAMARELLERDSTSKLLIFDQKSNPDLIRDFPKRIAFQRRDLNSVSNPRLSKSLPLDLQRGLRKLGRETIDLLINNAGIYDFGPVQAAPTSKLVDLFGINVVGHLLMLKAVMDCNQEQGVSNSENLRLAEIGSFQAINARAGRAAYAASKATAMDICQALAAGHEVERALYFAVPPTDTPMLHYNYWATKIDGEVSFWQELLAGNRALYQGVFSEVSSSALEQALVGKDQDQQNKLRQSFASYREFRHKALRKRGREGVASAEEVAHSIVRWCISSDPMLVERGNFTDALITYQVSDDYPTGKRIFHEDPPVSFGAKGSFSKHVSSLVEY